MNRQSLLAVTLIILVGVMIAAISLLQLGQETGGESQAIRAATLQGGISTLDVMEKLGIYREHGFKLKVLRFQKTPEILAAISSGDADVAVVPAEMAAKMIMDGEKIVVIAVDMMQNQAILSLNPGIKSICGLEGKLVGAVVASGTYKLFKAYTQLICNISVVETGRPGKGYVAVVNTPPGSLMDALAKRDVDAVVAWEPLVSKIMVSLNASIVSEYSSLWRKASGKGEPVMLVWIVRKDFLDKNHGLVEKLLEARRDSAGKWVDDRKAIIQMLMQLYSMSREEAEKLYSRVAVNTEPLNSNLINSIREEWVLAWRGGYLPENPESLGEEYFYTS